MIELQFEAPLNWPETLPQTERLKRANNPQFSMSMTEAEAIGFLQDEINRTPAVTSAKLSCNAMNILSPMPTQYISKLPGAAVKLKIDGANYTLGCDKWMTLAHNIYALHLAIRQYRQLEEWGIAPLSILLAGFNEQGAAHNGAAYKGEENWYAQLGLNTNSTLEDANAAYRARAKQVGMEDADALQHLNLAIAAARKHFGA